eukprot:8469802-Prorocentrum_lima.AAC.1
MDGGDVHNDGAQVLVGSGEGNRDKASEGVACHVEKHDIIPTGRDERRKSAPSPANLTVPAVLSGARSTGRDS